MTEAFGNDWIKHRAPGNLRQAWLNKKQKAQNNDDELYLHVEIKRILKAIGKL